MCVCGGCKVMQCPQPYARTQTRTHAHTYNMLTSAAEPRGVARNVRPRVLILSFSCSFRQKICRTIGWRTPPSPLGVGGPPLGNPGPTTEHTSFSCLHLFTKRVRWKKKKKKKNGSNFLEMSVAAPAAASCVYE